MSYIIIAFIVWMTVIACMFLYRLKALTDGITKELDRLTSSIANISVNIKALRDLMLSQWNESGRKDV